MKELRFSANARKQMRSLKDLKVISFILFFAIVLTIIFSYIAQQTGSSVRNVGRELHTQQFNLIINISKLQTIFTQGAPYDIKTIININDQIKIEHTYLRNYTFNDQGIKLFKDGEDIYVNFQNNMHIIVGVSNNVIYIHSAFIFLNEYLEKVVLMYNYYTQVFADNNALSQIYMISSISIEFIILTLIIVFVFFPSVRNLEKSIILHASSEEEKKEIIKELPMEIVNLPLDVKYRGIDLYGNNNYDVTGIEKNYRVLESNGKVICECKIYKNTGGCIHVRRVIAVREAKQLQKEMSAE